MVDFKDEFEKGRSEGEIATDRFDELETLARQLDESKMLACEIHVCKSNFGKTAYKCNRTWELSEREDTHLPTCC